MSELFSFGHKKLLNPLLMSYMLVLAAKVADFKADYSVKLMRCGKMNAIVALGECMNFSFFCGHKKLLNPLLKSYMLVLSANIAVFKAGYSVNLRRCGKTNAIVALEECMNSSVLGKRNY